MAEPQAYDRLRNYPVSFFGVVLGLLGLTLAVQKATHVVGVPWIASSVLLVITLLVAAFVLAAYATKAAIYPAAVREDFAHPIRVNFFPILAKIPLILSIILLERSMVWSHAAWLIGASAQLAFSLVIVSRWLGLGVKNEHLSPAWFIPIVGSVIVPIAGVSHGYTEISWFFFSIGLLFWLVLLGLMLNRLVLGGPLPVKFAPTLFILFAPPAIAFIAYTRLSGGHLTELGRVLYYVALFTFALVMMKLPQLTKIPFFLSWWAFTFPLAAITLATFLMAQLTAAPVYMLIGSAQLVLLAVLVTTVGSKTFRGIWNRQLCVEE